MIYELPMLERLTDAAKPSNLTNQLGTSLQEQTNASFDQLTLAEDIEKLQRCGFLPFEAASKDAA